MRSSIDAKGSSPSETIPSIPLVVPEETEDMKDSTDEEFSLKDLADNVIYDNQAKRSSIQSIKIFARKNDDSPEDTKSKPGVSTIKFQVHNEDGTKINLSDDEDNDANDDTNESAHSNPLNIENENGTDEDSKGENGEYSETVSLSSKPIGFMETGSASIVEETLEELNWTGLTDTKTLELNISNEIAKIESQNLFNIVDLDDKLDDLDASLANAIKECEKLDTIFAFFSVQLSTFSDEIAHIEDQGEGLQVQTRNQKVLWTELNNILHTVSLPQEALAALKTHGFEKIQDIETIERRTAKERSNLMQQQPQGTRNSVIGQPGNITEGFVSDYEDKELLNYHILMIENTTVMNEGLEPFEHNNSVLHGLYQLTQTTLRNEMDLYVKFLMYRPVGKFRSFVDDVESVYKKNANDNPATKPGLSRSSLKKLLLGYDVKELRKGLELLHKRIEKHFGDLVVDDAGNIGQTDTAFQRRLISKTWKFVEAEYSTLFSKLRMICERHYSAPGESGYVCAVEFSDADISNAFNAFVQY
ncbi:hypothetical protein D0Z03_001697 [Geotrichum reessii]|nr:hypothetical protein D0Z03_001697 [Galactomyces reessii]